MNNTIDVRHILEILKSKFYVLFICIIFCGAAAIGLTYFFVEPIYEASSQVLIEQAQADNKDQLADQTSTQLLNTYLVIIKSASITENISRELTFEMKPKDVSNSLTVENVSGSRVIAIVAKADTPEKATELANETTQELKSKAPKILKNSSVVILEDAVYDDSKRPISPNYKTIGTLGIFIGIFTGVVVIYLYQILTAKIRRKEDIDALTKYPVLGKVSQVK